MFLETVRAEGLAQLSYLVGDGHHAAVVDPRRDVGIYLELARRHGARIEHVFETHRHEDFVSGATELARRTGARVHHGGALDFGHGEAVAEGDTFEVGAVQLGVLETPGHTDESISVVVRDRATGDAPLAVFTGDALFVGDVGRTDFHPERADADAGALFDSLHEKLLTLGDQVILLPAHGAGSVCGAGIAGRDFSTLGYERRHNTALRRGRHEFVLAQAAERHPSPPYFRRMEQVNRAGAAALPLLPRPTPLEVTDFAARIEAGAVVVDVRSVEAIAAARVPGSLGIPLDHLPSYAGWFLDAEREIALVADSAADVEAAVALLVRLGYENVDCWLASGIASWETAGRPLASVGVVTARQLADFLRGEPPLTVLDVRSKEEFESGHLTAAVHAPLTALDEHLDALPEDRPLVTVCGSGRRALIAATILDNAGLAPVAVCPGSMAACRQVGCPIVNVHGSSS